MEQSSSNLSSFGPSTDKIYSPTNATQTSPSYQKQLTNSELTKKTEPTTVPDEPPIQIPPVPPCSPRSATSMTSQHTFLSKRDSDSFSIVAPSPMKRTSKETATFPDIIPPSELLGAKRGARNQPPLKLLKDYYPDYCRSEQGREVAQSKYLPASLPLLETNFQLGEPEENSPPFKIVIPTEVVHSDSFVIALTEEEEHSQLDSEIAKPTRTRKTREKRMPVRNLIRGSATKMMMDLRG